MHAQKGGRLLGNTSGRKKPVAFTEDTAVPPEHLADYIMEFRDLLDANNLAYGMFGHVDSGVLHVRPALDLCDPEQEVLMRSISDQVVALTSKYGGLMWGEHGRGFRSEYGPEFFGPELFAELRKVKGAFDPLNRMNPGKICTPIASDDELVSVDAVKRGTSIARFRKSCVTALKTPSTVMAMACASPTIPRPPCALHSNRPVTGAIPQRACRLMREWLRQLEHAGVDILTEEAVLSKEGLRLKDLVGQIFNTLAKRRAITTSLMR